jgi:hypothetical protein
MTREGLEQQLNRHKAAFAACDIEALASGHTAEGTFESPAYGIVRGRDAIRDVYRYWYKGFPGFLLTWDHALIDVPRASFIWTFDGKSGDHFFGEIKPGTHVMMTGAAEYLFTDEGIESARHVFDFSGILTKTGVLKIRPA